MAPKGFFGRILASFLLYGAALALILALVGLHASSHLGRRLLIGQAEPILNVLIEAELENRARDRESDTEAIAEALGWRFLAGKQVPAEWLALEDGLHFSGKNFLLLRRLHDVPYCLNGPAQGFLAYLPRLGLAYLALGAGALGAAALLAWLLASRLSDPLRALARRMDKANASLDIPGKILAREDEAGLLARRLDAYEREKNSLLRREAAFTGHASHELRTPLAIMKGALELLEVQKDEEAREQSRARMLRAVDGMSLTVEALLSLARGASLETSPLLPGPFFLDCLRQMGAEVREEAGGAIARLAGATLRLDLTKGLEISTNPALARAVFRNLAENSCRHAADGEVFVKISDTMLEISNKTGPYGGRGEGGLGLALVSRACERLGWKYFQEEKDGLFRFTIHFIQE